MVRLTRAVVLQGISKVSIDKRDTLEIDKEFGRITHLHLQRKNITNLDSLHLFQSLTVLYLYENQISKIEGLEQAHNLEILHLQRNRIKRIENLLECRQLKKLYLGYNEIETVEGLHNLEKLEELHVERQRLSVGTSLTFDPKTLATLSNTLIVLNIAGNNVTHIEDLAGMEEMHTLLAGDNSISDLDSAALVVRTLGNLQVLDLRDNPIAKRPQFKERIIGYGASIAILNDKEVTDTMRDFIQRFAAVKAIRLQNAVSAYHLSRNSELAEATSSEQGASTTSAPIRSEGSRHGVTTPSRTNLQLGYSNPHFSTSPSSSLTQNLNQSLTHMSAYLRNTERSSHKPASMPQFILAPPKFNQADGGDAGGPPSRPKKVMSRRKGSVSVPAFRKKSSLAGEIEGSNSESLFKAPKAPGDMWRSTRTFVKLIKPPTTMRCSRENFLEGMPMPSRALLHLDSEGHRDMTIPQGHAPNLSPRVRQQASAHRNKSSASMKEKKMLHSEFEDKPPFTTSVYELPPWPHIVRRWAAEQPAVTFMP